MQPTVNRQMNRKRQFVILLKFAFGILRTILKGSQAFYRNYQMEKHCVKTPLKAFRQLHRESSVPLVKRPDSKNLTSQCKSPWDVQNWNANPGRVMIETKPGSLSLNQVIGLFYTVV